MYVKRGVRCEPGLSDSMLGDSSWMRAFGVEPSAEFSTNLNCLVALLISRCSGLVPNLANTSVVDTVFFPRILYPYKGHCGKSTDEHSCCPSPPNSNSAASLGDSLAWKLFLDLPQSFCYAPHQILHVTCCYVGKRRSEDAQYDFFEFPFPCASDSWTLGTANRGSPRHRTPLTKSAELVLSISHVGVSIVETATSDWLFQAA